MAALSVELIRRRVSEWLRAFDAEPYGSHELPPIPSPRLLQDTHTWRPSGGHLARVNNEDDYKAASDQWGLAPYYYEGPGAYELQHVHGMCGCRYLTLRRVAVLVTQDIHTIDAEDCQEPIWAPDIRTAAAWQAPEELYAEFVDPGRASS
jgi:hypothetical protein